jgi:hypothetical protein
MYHKQDQVNLGRPSGDEHKESVSCIPKTGPTSAGWGNMAYGGEFTETSRSCRCLHSDSPRLISNTLLLTLLQNDSLQAIYVLTAPDIMEFT